MTANHIIRDGGFNLPPGVTQSQIDRYFGAQTSDAAADAYDFHAHAQARIADLLSFLSANEDQMGPDYEDLRGALQEATYTPMTIQDIIADAEADRAEDVLLAEGDRLYDEGRDEGRWRHHIQG